MQDWQARVIAERDALKLKYESLLVFTNTNAFESLHPQDAYLMNAQCDCMAQYLHILNMRIVRFERD